MTMTLNQQIRAYWNTHIHDLKIATAEVGSAEFFDQLATYRFNKLQYLPQIVNFNSYADLHLLEVGCGAGLDLRCFANGAATTIGIDLSDTAIQLARQNFAQKGLDGQFFVMDGEQMLFPDNTFDLVYAHGVLQYTADAHLMIAECYRVLRPGGTLISMVYNRYSWLPLISRLTNTTLEHEDAPVLKTYSIPALRQLLRPFSSVTIIPERFPVPTELHSGLKARLYNDIFVNTFNQLPRALVRPFGWHLMGFATK